MAKQRTFEESFEAIAEIRRRSGGRVGTPAEQAVLASIQTDLQGMSAKDVNQDTGASLMERAQVGAARTPEEKLATTRKFYPESVPYGDDNFLAVNRANNQPFLFNPPGLDIGDAANYGREITTIGAGILGSMVSSPSALFSGPVVPYAGGAAAATGAGYLYDQAMEYLGETVDTRTLGEQVEDYTLEAVLNLVPYDKALAMFGKGMLRGKDAVNNVIAKYGMDATAGTVGSGILKTTEAGQSKLGVTMDAFNTSADRMYESVAKVITQLRQEGLRGSGEITEETLTRLSPVTAAEEAVAAAKAYIENHRLVSNQLYAEFDTLVPPNTQVIPLNFYEAARGMLGTDGLGAIVEDPIARKLFEAGGQGSAATTYEAVKQIRTMLGKKMRGGMEGLSAMNASELYDALTEDMVSIAAQQGDEAVAALTKANDFYRAGRVAIDESINPIMKTADGKNWKEATQLSRDMARMAREKPVALGKLNQSTNPMLDPVLPDEQMQRVGVGMLDDLAEPTKAAAEAVEEGALSPSRIIAQTSDQTISPIAKDYLFNATQREIMDDLRVFAGSVKETENLVNRSNSATQILGPAAGLGSVGLALAGDPITGGQIFLSTVVAPYLTARGMQSKPFIKWINQGIDKGTGAEWYRSGARMAASIGLQNLYEVIGESIGAEADKGLLAE